MYSVICASKVLEVNPFTPANDVTEHNKYSFHAHTSPSVLTLTIA